MLQLAAVKRTDGTAAAETVRRSLDRIAVMQQMQEVHRLELKMQMDYRFNRPLADVCDRAVFVFCADACDTFSGLPCDGAVLACLRRHQAEIGDARCKEELDFWAAAQVCSHLSRFFTPARQ